MFLCELIVIGIVVGIIGTIISTIIMYMTDKNFSLKKYTFWPSIFFSFFFTGVITHVLFEVLGLNKWYCKYGNACKKN